jgi:hypothetical protein
MHAIHIRPFLVGLFLACAVLSSATGAEAVFTPTEDVFSAPYIPYNIDAEPKFSREPDLYRTNLQYGLIQAAREPDAPAFGFIYDAQNQKLYIDQNGNFDLNDDPGNPFVSNSPDPWVTVFRDIPITITDSETGTRGYSLEINFYSGPNLNTSFSSGWGGTIETTQGDLGMVVIDNFDGEIDGNDWLCFNPETGLPSGPHPLRNEVFFKGQTIQFDFRFAPDEDGNAVLKVTSTLPVAEMGTLIFAGDHIDQAVLTSPTSLVFLDKPGARAEIPAGVYTLRSLSLTSGIQAENPGATFISLEPGGEFNVPFGEEPRPSVVVKKTMGGVLLSYQLAADGQAYRQELYSDPPPYFKVMKNGRVIAQHSFEYG